MKGGGTLGGGEMGLTYFGSFDGPLTSREPETPPPSVPFWPGWASGMPDTLRCPASPSASESEEEVRSEGDRSGDRTEDFIRPIQRDENTPDCDVCQEEDPRVDSFEGE